MKLSSFKLENGIKYDENKECICVSLQEFLNTYDLLPDKTQYKEFTPDFINSVFHKNNLLFIRTEFHENKDIAESFLLFTNSNYNSLHAVCDKRNPQVIFIKNNINKWLTMKKLISLDNFIETFYNKHPRISIAISPLIVISATILVVISMVVPSS